MPNVKYQRGCAVKGTAVSSLLTSFSALFSVYKRVLRQWSSSLRVFCAYCAVTEIVCCFGPASGRIILNKSQMNVGGERRKIISNKEGHYQLSSQCWSYGVEKWKQEKGTFFFFKMGNFSWKICSDQSLVFHLNLQQIGIVAAVLWSTEREDRSRNKPPKLERIFRFLVHFGQRGL